MSTEAGRKLWPVADINLTGFYNFLDSFSTFCSYDIPNLFNIEIKIFVQCCNNDCQIISSSNFSKFLICFPKKFAYENANTQ